MSEPLANNPGHLVRLCEALALGNARAEPSAVPGGFHHRMWRLETDRGLFAVKQLAPDAALGGGETGNHFNITEGVADAFGRRGIPSLHAICGEAGFLQCLGDIGYLVYPWTDATARDRHQVSSDDAVQVATLLAQMHRADIADPGLADPAQDIHPQGTLELLVATAHRRNILHGRLLRDLLPAFRDILRVLPAATQRLQHNRVVCHGDLDHKNVLWTRTGHPLLIDWESARRLTPGYELLLEALDWSGITSGFHFDRFAQMLDAYRRAGGVIEEEIVAAAFDCIQGDWLNWMLYNVGRAVDLADAEQRAVGADQVDLALATLLRLRRLLPRLLALATGR